MAEKSCPVHGTKLKRKSVPIEYGYPDFDPAWEVGEKLFPHSHSYALGGCLISPDNPEKTSKMVCEDCRKAEAEWRKENDKEVFNF